MSLKVLRGRKRGNPVWSHFKYESATNKSTCMISGVGVNEGKSCGRLIPGNNTTNLLNHLKYHHPTTYKEVCAAGSDRKRSIIIIEGNSAKTTKTERQNKKILEMVEEQKKRLRQQTTAPGIMAATKDGMMPGMPSGTLPANSNSSDSQHMAAAQKAALQHAHANSVGYFITQDSAFGNLILPVLPRFDK